VPACQGFVCVLIFFYAPACVSVLEMHVSVQRCKCVCVCVCVCVYQLWDLSKELRCVAFSHD